MADHNLEMIAIGQEVSLKFPVADSIAIGSTRIAENQQLTFIGKSRPVSASAPACSGILKVANQLQVTQTVTDPLAGTRRVSCCFILYQSAQRGLEVHHTLNW
jgi:hypothetical protein